MIIQHNVSAINSYRSSGINQSALGKDLEKLSSGYKINRAGDNAAGLTIFGSVGSQINGLNQASANTRNAIGLIKTTEDTLSGVHSMLQRMTALTEQVANGTCSTVARGNIQEEYKALTKEIKRIFEDADFNGTRSLTTGKEVTMTFQTDLTLDETITVNKEDIYGETATAAMDLKPSVQNDTKNALKTTRAAIGDVSTYRAKLGAAQNRLEHIVKSLDIMSKNIIEVESRTRGTDMADEITTFIKDNVLLQVAQSMLTQSNAAPQGILNLP